MDNLDKIKREYITSNISYRGLCEKHGVPFGTLKRYATRDKWHDQREKYRQEVDTKSIKKAVDDAVDYRSTLYKLAANVAQQLVEMQSKYTLEEMAAIGIRPREITGAIKDLEDALHVKSEADIKEQEARIAKLRKEAESAEAKDTKVIVQFEEDISNWNK